MRAFLFIVSGGVLLALGALNVNLAHTPIDISPIASTAPFATGGGEGRTSVMPQASVPLTELRETIERPLFMPSRRPVQARPAAARNIPPPVEVEQAPINLRLSGTIHTGSSAGRALIVSSGEPKGRWLEEGAEIEGWSVVAVERFAVQMRSGQRLRQLDMH